MCAMPLPFDEFAVGTAVLVVVITVLMLRRRTAKPSTQKNPALTVDALQQRHQVPSLCSAAVRPLLLPVGCAVEDQDGSPVSQNCVINCGALPEDRCPALVFVNRNSGGQLGEALLQDFREHLSPLQVWDLVDGGPGPALALFRTVPRLRVLACGGDGTIAWVGQAMRDAEFREEKHLPAPRR